jgi:exodeoxyribonuclease VII small subunit
MNKKSSKDIEKLPFEESLKELETIVRELEAGGQDLDSSIEYYTRGTALKKHCEAKLSEAKLKVEKIIAAENSEVKTEPFDVEKS